MNVMITSTQNERVKEWRKLHTRKGRSRANMFLVEGFHLIEEALKSHWTIEQLIVEDGKEVPTWAQSLPMTIVSSSVFNDIAQTETPQGIAAVVQMKTLNFNPTTHVLLIDAIQDPGNLGTIIRTADAAGFSAIFLGQGTVDMYNDKVVRATQGSLFHIPIIQTHLEQTIKTLRQKGYKIWATDITPEASVYHQKDVPNKSAVILGNEGAGIDQNFVNQADTVVKIPIYGQAESLNVSVAAGILMYYLRR